MPLRYLASKIYVTIVSIAILIFGFASFAEYRNFQSQRVELQNLSDIGVLAGARTVSKTMGDITIENISITAIKQNNQRDIKFSFSSQLSERKYLIELTSKYEPKYFAFFGFSSNIIKVTSTAPAIKRMASKIIVAVDIDDSHTAFITNDLEDRTKAMNSLGHTWLREFDVVNGGVSGALIFASLQTTPNDYVLLLVTNVIADPALCSKIKSSGLEVDVIYYGDASPSVETFYDKCITPHPMHACMADRPHYVSDNSRMAFMVSWFIKNYGIMRVSC